MIDYYEKLKKEVIDQNLCTHCGTCVGLCPSKLEVKQTKKGPLPMKKEGVEKISQQDIYEYCPGRRINYGSLNKFVFAKKPKSLVTGNILQSWIGYATDEFVRTNGASAGIISQVAIYLLEEKLIDGVVVVKQGEPKPYLAKPIIATSKKEILDCAQSVYVPVMVNSILKEIKNFKGKLAYVGLPDQVAAIRKLQKDNNPLAQKIEYVLGPYVGTAIYLDAIKSFLKAHKVDSLEDISYMKYRDGEWPGHLRIDTKDGASFKSKKFYYNYLIPFYITQATLYSVDFTNELTDISVGDAWHPKYESLGKGFSVVLARSKKGERILKAMEKKKVIELDAVSEIDLVNMHGHMIDFKKRGSFIRMKFKRIFGGRIPKYDYEPERIGLKRYIVEFFIYVVFALGSTWLFRRLIEILPLPMIGRFFNTARLTWKKVSKSTKRTGIMNMKFKYIR